MNLLITGSIAWTKEELNQISDLGHNIVFMQQEKDPLPCDAKWIEGIIGNGIFLHHDIEKFVNLKYIQLTSAGFDRVPMDYVKEHDISIFNARGVYSIPMAEFAISGVLQLYKQSRFFLENQKEHRWEKHRGLLELNEKKVCIVGCGSVGDECAKRFKAFGCEIIGVNRTKKKSSIYDEIVGIHELDLAIENADIVIVTLAFTEDTFHLINKKRLAKLKKEVVLVNLSRGEVIETQSLIEKLPKIKGAVLDVFEEEPLAPDNQLWDMNNVIITPHVSFIGDNNNKRLARIIFEHLKGR